MPHGLPPSPGFAQQAALFHALADPVRLALVAALQEGPQTVTALVQRTQVAQPTVSKHLARLRVGGLVRVEREGRTATYHLVPAVVWLVGAADRFLDATTIAADHTPR